MNGINTLPAHFRILLLPCLLFLVTACGLPVGVKRVDPRVVHQHLTRNVLSAEKPSGPSMIVLNRHDLSEGFKNDPKAALAELHNILVSGKGGADEMCALAELSFLLAEKTKDKSYYLSAAVYAYGFLFPGEGGEPPDPFDPRFRLACDLYNRGLTSGFESQDHWSVEPRSGTFDLSFGRLEVAFDSASLQWYGRELVSFEPVAELEVKGLRNRYRQSGIGAPLAAVTVRPADSQTLSKELVGPKIKVPVTLVLRMDNVRHQLGGKIIHGDMRLYSTVDVPTVDIDGRNVPLEAEPTASLASTLADSNVWEMELKGFFGGEFTREIFQANRRGTQLVALHPYQPGLMPVVFVHGTASSAGRWAEMSNELLNDPVIRQRFQFWYFFYDTGNPIAYSAMLLRDTLEETLQRVDPEGKDPALYKMIVIGHSQGGLLTKMTAIDSGSLFWDNLSRKPLDELKMPETTRDLLRRGLFLKPLPYVHRLVFIATPHGGSYIAAWGIIKRVTGLLVKPATVVLKVASDVLAGSNEASAFAPVRSIPTSVENMQPGNRFIKTLASIPVAPGVAYHSIIAVKQSENMDKGNDGVVAYKSAHIEGAQSELVVHSDHSCQGNPHTIEEVRRILLLQARMEQ